MNENKVKILLLRGAPGVGKTSAVRKLRKSLPQGASIEIDTLRGMIAAVKWVDTKQHMLALEHAFLLTQSFLKEEYRPVVIVDTFSRGKLQMFTEKLYDCYKIISLYAEQKILEQRVLSRPDNEFKDLASCFILNEEITKNRYAHEQQLDTSYLTPEEVALWILKILQGEGH